VNESSGIAQNFGREPRHLKHFKAQAH
jgi:hypothetical protein